MTSYDYKTSYDVYQLSFVISMKLLKGWVCDWNYIPEDMSNIILMTFSVINNNSVIGRNFIKKIFYIFPNLDRVAFLIYYFMFEEQIFVAGLMILNRR